MSVLRLEHVTKRFGGLVAVNDLSFEVKERQIHALIGPNGSGKSTSINMINGSFPVTSGKIYFNDKDITGWKMHDRAGERDDRRPAPFEDEVRTFSDRSV